MIQRNWVNNLLINRKIWGRALGTATGIVLGDGGVVFHVERTGSDGASYKLKWWQSRDGWPQADDE